MKDNFVKLFFILLLIAAIVGGCGRKNKNNKTELTTIPSDLKQLNDLIANNPDNPDLFHQRAIYYLEHQQLDSAMVDLRCAINIDSNRAELMGTLADIYFMQGYVSKSKNLLQKTIEKNPKYVEGYLKLAEIYFLYKDYNTMNSLLQKVIELDSKNAKAYFMRGMALKEQGDTAKAEIEILRAIDYNQDYYDAYMQLGIINLDRNNHAAEAYLNNAINIRPKSIEAHYALGMFYQQNNNPEKAIAEYNTILAIDSKYKYAHYNLGWVNLVLLNKFDEAILHFKDAVALDSTYFEAYYNIGHCYELKNNIPEARKYFKKSLEIETNYDMAIEGLNRLDKMGKR